MTLLKAIILAGGFATRLRPLSCSRPKTLFPIVNKPLLEWILEGLAKNDVKEAVLAVNALTQFHIRQQKTKKHGLKIKYSIDPPKTPLGTAGPIKNAEKFIGHDEPFIVLNGDIFTEIDYKSLLATHLKKKALATIALCRVEDPCRYGVADLDGNSCIKNFIEKPAKEQAPTNLINAGVYILNPEVFDYIPKGKYVSMEREVFPQLAKEKKLFGYTIDGLWMDIGKPEEYLQTNKVMLDVLSNKKAINKPTKFKTQMPVAIGRGVTVGEKSIIGPYAVLGKNVIIGKNTVITNSVVFSDARICDNVNINGAIIGEGSFIGRNAKINAGCIIADQVKIRENVSLSKESAVCPAKEISETILKRNIIC